MIWNDEYGYYANMIKDKPVFIKKFDKKYFEKFPEKMKELFEINHKIVIYLDEEDMFKNIDLISQAIKKDNTILKDLPSKIKQELREECIDATRENPSNLRYIPMGFRDEKLCLDAFEKSIDVISSIPEQILIMHPEICKKAVETNSEYILDIPEEVLEKNTDLYEIALADNPNLKDDLPEEIFNENPRLIEILIDKIGYVENLPNEIEKQYPKIYWKNMLVKPLSSEEKEDWLRSLDENIDSHIYISIYSPLAPRGLINLKKMPEDILKDNSELINYAFEIDSKMFIEEFKNARDNRKNVSYSYYYTLRDTSDLKLNVQDYIDMGIDKNVIADNIIQLIDKYPKDKVHDFMYLFNASHDTDLMKIIAEKRIDIVAKNQATFRSMLENNSELYVRGVKEYPETIFQVPEKFQKQYKKEFKEIFKKVEDLEYYSSMNYLIPEIQSSNIELCKKAIDKDAGNCRLFKKTVLTKIFKKFPELPEKIIKEDADNVKYMSKEIQLKNLNLLLKAIQKNPNNIKYIDKEIQIDNPSLGLKAIQKDPKVFYLHGFEARDDENILKFMYGDNYKRIKRIKDNSYMNLSRNYKPEVMERLYKNMLNSIGIDNMERLLEIPKLSKDEIEKFLLIGNELFESNFETKYIVAGKQGMVLDIIRKMPVAQYREKGKNEPFKIYKTMLDKLEKGNNMILKDLITESILENDCSINENTQKQIESLSNLYEKKIIELNLNKFDQLLLNDLQQIVPLQRNAAVRIIKDIIGNLKLQSSHIEKNQIMQELNDKLVTDNYSNYIVENRECLIEAAYNLINDDNNMEIINKNCFDILKEFKENARPGWIRNFLNFPIQMTKEEFDNLQDRIGMEFDYESVSVLKDENENFNDIYKLLVNKEIPTVMTYEKAELMFGGIIEPYSEKFQEFFGKNKNDILNNIEFCMKFSKIHNNFDKILEKLGKEVKNVESIVDTYNNLGAMKYRGVTPENMELAKLADKFKYKQSQFDKVAEIFEETRKREETTIPNVKTKSVKNYRGRILDIKDALILFVGEITNCCQIIDDAGETSMIHSATNKNGNVFVVELLEDKGDPIEVVAQSWVWRNKDRLCFDNIELVDSVVRKRKLADDIISIYEEAGELALQKDKQNLKKQLEKGEISQQLYDEWVLKDVTVGLGCTTELPEIKKKRRAEIVLPEDDGKYLYTDAVKDQVIVASMLKDEKIEINERKENYSKLDNEQEPNFDEYVIE